MRTMTRSFLFTAIFLSLLPPHGAQATTETQEQLQQDFEAKDYQKLLPKLNQALALKGPAAAGYDRYKLLLLKGETQLRIPPGKSAADAFKAASLVAPDADSTAIAKATFVLVNRSSNGKFQPKKPADSKSSQPPAAIDILDPDSRKQAFAALFAEMVATDQPMVDRTEQMTTLPPIVSTAQKLGDLRPVEIAASGSDDKSKEMLKKIATHAQTLMSDAIKNMDAQLKALQTDAEKRVKTLSGRRRANSSEMSEGLTPSNVDQAQSIADQAKQLASAATQMDTVFGDAADFKTVETDAQKTVQDAQDLLKKYGPKSAT